ncbi:MAG: Arc family DNA-binding protein [Actinobacteria bacterium]|nr:Arc family DNA-binding protein [Actinomycetota bacterium]
MPTLNIRNVQKDVVDSLKRLAKKNGRSLNAEVVEALKDYSERESRTRDLLRQLDEFRAEFSLPEDAPKPEDLIREARDERAREIDRRARGL